MARPIWTGSLAFGLVSVPVGMYAATEDRSIHFHQVQRGTQDRVRYKRVNERTGREVEWSDVVKGYPLDDGRYVTLEREELAEIGPGRSRTIEIEGFVPLAEIDPVFFQRSYYLLPAREQGEHAYALLRAAMHESDRAAVARLVMRDKQHLAAVRAEPDALVLETLYFADEIRRPDELAEVPRQRAGRAGERKQAQQLIDAMTIEWRPEEHRDDYRERVEELVEAKRQGVEPPAAEEAPEPTNVVDLVDALQRSVEQARGRRGGRRDGGRVRAKDGGRAREKDGRTAGGRRRTSRRASADAAELRGLSKTELYRRAGQLEIAGRSRMSRAELERAVRDRAA